MGDGFVGVSPGFALCLSDQSGCGVPTQVEELLGSRGDEREEHVTHQLLARDVTSLVRALRHGAKEREHRGGDASQDGDDKGSAGVGFYPGMRIFRVPRGP